MNDEKDIWAERLHDRDYAKMDPDPFIQEWINKLRSRLKTAFNTGDLADREIDGAIKTLESSISHDSDFMVFATVRKLQRLYDKITKEV